MKKINLKLVYSILSIVFIFLLGILLFYKNISNLSDSFTVRISRDETSSAAGRVYESILTFSGSKLVSGFQSFVYTQGAGCKTDCFHRLDCTIKNGYWIDLISGGKCELSTDIVPTTKEEVERQIKNKKLKPIGECYHYDTCFEILN